MPLTIGQAVQHPKFGIGVTMVVDGGNACILFESGPRVLVASFVTSVDDTPESDALKASVGHPVPTAMSASDAKPWIETQVEKSKKRASAVARPKKAKKSPVVEAVVN
jgi:hypothetical protein